MAGPKSGNIVVNTMVETPGAPTTVIPFNNYSNGAGAAAAASSSNNNNNNNNNSVNINSSIGARRISLLWKARNAFNSTRNKAVQKKMVGQWTGSGGDSSEGVSAELAFQQYDRLGLYDYDTGVVRISDKKSWSGAF
jgi:hypothetical protein